MSTIIDGKLIAEKIHAYCLQKATELRNKCNKTPGLAVILVGDNPASISYVTAKERACEKDGFTSREIRLPEATQEAELIKLVKSLNEDPSIDGILVQLPLPKHINPDSVIDAIAPDKDVDGFTPINIGKMLIGRDAYVPCTPRGILHILSLLPIDTNGKHAVVIGRSNIVGRPMANLLSQKRKGGNMTVTICHTGTKDLAKHTKKADVLIVAAGRPQTVTGDMIKEGAIVIDVGVNRIPDSTLSRGYRLIGDVDFATAKEKASFITPVPGGVGPLTIACLMENTLQAAFAHAGETLI